MTLARMAILAALVLSTCGAAQATSVTFTGSQGTLDAWATFGTSGSNLVVTLANISSTDCLIPADLLGSVFFDVAGSPTLTRGSAVLPLGSEIYQKGAPKTPLDRVVGGNWAYTEGIGGAPNSAHYGISSTGLDIFGPHDVFPGEDLGGDTGNPPDGMSYSLLSAGDNLSTGNKPLLKWTFIKSSVVFTLGGLPSDFDPSTGISNVYFQYGTDLCEPGFPGEPPDEPPPPPPIPEPVTMASVLCGLAMVGGYVRRRFVA